MTAIAHYSQELYNSANSKTTSSPVTATSAKEVPTICIIKTGFLLPMTTYKTYAEVLQPFYIQLVHTDDGYIATSPISDIYEQDVLVGDTVRAYLYTLLDELLWLQEQKENLSDAIRKQLNSIQSYIRVM